MDTVVRSFAETFAALVDRHDSRDELRLVGELIRHEDVDYARLYDARPFIENEDALVKLDHALLRHGRATPDVITQIACLTHDDQIALLAVYLLPNHDDTTWEHYFHIARYGKTELVRLRAQEFLAALDGLPDNVSEWLRDNAMTVAISLLIFRPIPQ